MCSARTNHLNLTEGLDETLDCGGDLASLVPYAGESPRLRAMGLHPACGRRLDHKRWRHVRTSTDANWCEMGAMRADKLPSFPAERSLFC